MPTIEKLSGAGDADDFEAIDRGLRQAEAYANLGGIVIRAATPRPRREATTMFRSPTQFGGFLAVSQMMPDFHPSYN